MSAPYDPRAVANLLLDLAQAEDGDAHRISNLVLQKLLYFAHAHFLIRSGDPLMSGCFEAWTYGPVHPAVYQAFKTEENRPIKTRALSRNPLTGEVKPLLLPQDPAVRKLLLEILFSYGKLSPGRLVEVTHAPKGPWWTVVNKAKTSVALGMRISDAVTLECFKHQKVAVGPDSRVGEPNEDTPLIGD